MDELIVFWGVGDVVVMPAAADIIMEAGVYRPSTLIRVLSRVHNPP